MRRWPATAAALAAAARAAAAEEVAAGSRSGCGGGGSALVGGGIGGGGASQASAPGPESAALALAQLGIPALSDLVEAARSRPQNDPLLRARSLSPAVLRDLAFDLSPGSPFGAGLLLPPNAKAGLSGSGSGGVGRPTSAHKRSRSALSQRIEVELVNRLSTMRLQKVKNTGINKFNTNPKEGLQYLVEQGLFANTPSEVCAFLATEGGLSKRKLGEYFGKDARFNQEVFSLFLGYLDFEGQTLDEALRAMVLKFRMPGEAQQIDRIMERFAERFHASNPTVFGCADTAYVLAFSLMMLNTDMYNRNLKEGEKMTMEQFVNNNRGIDQGADLPRDLLSGMYRRLRAAEIRMDEGDMFESEVITFVAPRMCGWLKKKSTGYFAGWKRHWFVLANGVLYYFFAPQDAAPRCIIPLEHIRADPMGSTDLII
ncbi:unnamed protein product, partial [Phaeothamnion confervicola]